MSKQDMIIIDQVGALWIDLTISVGHPCRLEIASWHTGVSCTAHIEELEEELDQFAELGLTLSMLCRETKARGWVADIPSDILDELIRLERLYYGSQFAALWFMSRSDFAVELFLSAPIIFYVLLDSARSGRITAERALKLTAARRRAILNECELPDRGSCLRLLGMLPAETLYPSDLVTLRQFFALHSWQRVNHVAYADMALLRCLLSRPALLGCRIITAYDGDWDWDWRRFDALCDDILRASRQLGRGDGYERIGECRTIREVSGLHDRLVIELNRIIFADRDNILFGVPPLLGNPTIQPIRDARTLHEEGACQRHCIAGYQREILTGRYYVYRVLAPERATLGVQIDESGKPSISQLKLKYNEAPSEQTCRAVRAWFEAELLTDVGAN